MRIRLKRTTDPALNNPSLDYGEPVYNQGSGELQIGKDDGGRDVFLNLPALQALISAGGLAEPAIARDVKPINTFGGSLTTGIWQTRDLNDLMGSGFALAGNQLTANFAGSRHYLAFACAPAFYVGRHQIRLKHNADYYNGSLAYNADNTGVADNNSFVVALLTIANGDTLSIEHRVSVTRSTYAAGNDCKWGEQVLSFMLLLPVGS